MIHEYFGTMIVNGFVDWVETLPVDAAALGLAMLFAYGLLRNTRSAVD